MDAAENRLGRSRPSRTVARYANIPMQRPADLGTGGTLTDEEFAQRAKQAQKQTEDDGEEFAIGDRRHHQSSLLLAGARETRSSSLAGRRSAQWKNSSPDARRTGRSEVLRGGLGPGSHFPDKVDSWEDFDIYSRCITRGMVSSMLPTLYNFGNEIIQAPGYVVIRNEMIHETRVIPIDGRPHAGKGITLTWAIHAGIGRATPS